MNYLNKNDNENHSLNCYGESFWNKLDNWTSNCPLAYLTFGIRWCTIFAGGITYSAISWSQQCKSNTDNAYWLFLKAQLIDWKSPEDCIYGSDDIYNALMFIGKWWKTIEWLINFLQNRLPEGHGAFTGPSPKLWPMLNLFCMLIVKLTSNPLCIHT